MRLRPLLLHVLLSFALVANGMSGAMASVHAACAHDTVAAAAPAVEAPAADAPCHEDMGMETSSAPSGMDHRDTFKHASSSDDEDCSNCATHCACACIAHGMAALMPPALLLPASAGIAYAPAPSYAHAAPALPYPVRPPIG